MATPKTIATKNPFALIQKVPSKWVGLKGTQPNGFLIFDTTNNGLRAGWINLHNTYFKRGRDTLKEIIPIYAPDSVLPSGKNNYINYISSRYKIAPTKRIVSSQDIFNLGKGITEFEAGKPWISDAELMKAYNEARKSVALPELKSGPQMAGGIFTALLAASGLFYLYKNKWKFPKISN